jgi:hypothetical protein
MKARVTLARYGRLALLGAAVAVSLARPASAQSLGTVAKETEAQRKTTKSSGKVYTNDSLRGTPAPTSAAPAPAAPSTPTADSTAADANKAKANSAKDDEAGWRDRIKTERDALARAESFSAALQSQINGLYGEFTACQSPPQCNDISAKRQKAIGELDRVKKEVETHTKAIADIQDEARKAGVPPGWVR